MCGCVCFIQILCMRSSALYNVGLALRPQSVMDIEEGENRERNIDRRGRWQRTVGEYESVTERRKRFNRAPVLMS